MTKARDLANSAAAFASVSATELGYVDGVTSAIQTQMDAKAPSSTAVTLTGTQTLTNKTLTSPVIASVINNTLTSTTGDIIYASAANTPARLGIGTTGQVLNVASGLPAWATASAGGMTLIESGTLSGNPLSTAAGIATLKVLEFPAVFAEISKRTEQLVAGIREAARAHRVRVQASSMGSMFGVYFLNGEAPEVEDPITNYEEAKKYVHSKRYAQFFHEMLNRGHYFAPSAFEAGFLSAAHTGEDIENTIDAVHQTFKVLG